MRPIISWALLYSEPFNPQILRSSDPQILRYHAQDTTNNWVSFYILHMSLSTMCSILRDNHTTFLNMSLSCDVCSHHNLRIRIPIHGSTHNTRSWLVLQLLPLFILAPLGVWWPFSDHHPLLLAIVFRLFFHQWSFFTSHYCSTELLGLF
jgi:hypothetical protein